MKLFNTHYAIIPTEITLGAENKIKIYILSIIYTGYVLIIP